MRRRLLMLGALALALGACGDDGERENRDRPPAPINVTAAVIDGGVQVSPRSFGAGPIRLIVTNQTGRAQSVTLETEDVSTGPGLTQTTRPIQPRDTALIEADVPEGAYALRTDDRRIKPAAVAVGASRPSSQDDLLLP